MYSAEHTRFLAAERKTAGRVRLAQVLVIALFIALWELAAQARWIDPFIFSRPSRVAAAAIKLTAGGDLPLHAAVTLAETAAGFALSTGIGVALAVLLWLSDFARRVAAPYLVVLNSLPKTALAPVIIVLAGNNVKSVVITAVMTSVIVTVMTVLAGFMAVDADKAKLIKTLGGTKRDELTKLVLPASVPAILNALKINVGLSFVGAVVGEFLVAKAGLGYLIVYGSQVFKMDWVMLGVVTLGGLAAGVYQLVAVAERRFARWAE